MNQPTTSLVRSSTVPMIRARVWGTAQAMIPTRMVSFAPSAMLIFRVCSGIDLLDKKAVTSCLASSLFALTNDPMQDEWRGKIWTDSDTREPVRSLSVGDAIEVDFCDGITMVAICLPCGWFVDSIGGDLPGAAHDGMVIRDFLNLLEQAATSWDRSDLVREMKPTQTT
jgi:hypothetical protein